MPFDATTRTTIHEAKAAVCQCPYCGRSVRATQRINYPTAAVGAYASVYRCLCGKFIGEPATMSKRLI